uniref:Putative g2/m phase-specific e3 ubiquitin-protein ligase n=1 Tax=Culex tarsalis TaxID=7177 RepID=A0A1Q3EXY7_CULTA
MSLSKSSTRAGPGCFICKSQEDDELLFGKFYRKWRIQVHYYCLLLTSNLVQNGETDDEGIFGFLQEDIRAEVARIKAQKCYVCKAPYANISCCAKKCFRTFHTVCGRRAGCLSHFVDTFQSWCDRHVEVDTGVRHGEEDACGICYEELGAWDKVESVRAPCCQNGWFHRRCVAQFAQSAGYFFKCPLCNNSTDQFKEAIQRRGVYIPEKDAAWELEPNAFGEQLERPSECDAEVCRCPRGRDYDTMNGKWDLRLCETCGSTCRHDLCMEVPTKNYVCNFCRPIVGDEPPAAVLALVEESRRAEAARRRASSTASDVSTSSSSTIRPRGRTAQRLRSLSTSSRGSTSTSSSSDIAIRKKPRRPLSSESDSGCDLHELIRKLPLRREAREKLIHGRIVIALEKLTADKIRQLSRPPKKAPIPLPSSQSSEEAAKFDFNYRAKMNKRRRKSVADLSFLRQVIRSDTDALTTTDDNQQKEDARTPSRKTGFGKQFKLRLAVGGGAKTPASRKRVVSSSESDPEAGAVPAKKSCPASAPVLNNKSKSRVSLFPPDNSENTCPNSPHKLTSGAATTTTSESDPSPVMMATIASPPAPPVERKGGEPKSTTKKCQTTLNSFFKKSPEEPSGASSGSGGGGTNPSSAYGESKSARKKHSAGGSRKKLVELDRSQRNLLDFFNRC